MERSSPATVHPFSPGGTTIFKQVLPWRRWAIWLALAFALPQLSLGQTINGIPGATPALLQGGAPAGSYALSGLDHVSPYGGHLNFSVPLHVISGRGDAGYTISLTIERRWIATYEAYLNRVVPYDHFWYARLTPYSPGLMVLREAGDTVLYCPPPPSTLTISHMQRTVSRMTFIAADGTETEFRDQQFSGQPLSNSCSGTGPSRGTTFVSDDGAAATFVSDSIVYDTPLEVNNAPQAYPTGNLFWRNGLRYRIVNGLVTAIRDRNGNTLTFNYDQLTPNIAQLLSIVDSINRTVNISYNHNSVPFRDDMTFKGFGGASRVLSVYYDLLSNRLRAGQSPKNYTQLFPELNGSPNYRYDTTNLPSAVQLPDGRQYQFYYNSYGELARVVLPAGGAIEYDFAPAGSNGTNVIGSFPNQIIYRRLTERRTYPDGNTLEQRILYSASYSGSTVSDFSTSVNEDHLDSGGNLLAHAVHVFYGNPFASQVYAGSSNSNLGFFSWKEGAEGQTRFYDVGGGRLLKTLNNAWAQRAPIPWWTDSPDLAPANDPRILAVYSTLDSNQVSEIAYGYDQFSNRTDVYEYDYGQNGPGALVRHHHTDFLTSNLGTDYTSPYGPHLRDLPALDILYQSNSGGSETQISQTYFVYDVDPASPRPGIAGLDSSYAAGYRYRGNLSQTSRWLNTGGQYLTTTFQYDVAGNVISATDPIGRTTTFDFADHFGGPDGDASSNTAPFELAGGYAFAFQTLIRNVLGHTSVAQYDYYTGQAVDSQDPNGTVTSRYYNDPLDRTTQLISAANRSIRAQSTVAYNDSSHTIITTSDQNTFGDDNLRNDLIYDGLGRTIETRQFENATSYIASRRQFDGMGRVSQVFNPYRPSDVQVSTSTLYDGLDRPTSVTATDGSITQMSYAGNQTVVTDPANHTRATTADAPGRLTRVTEYPVTGTSYYTEYSWDVLDDLIHVSQGSSQRYFNYDSLRRLISAANPESGNINYTYDNNGNLTRKVDSRSVTTSLTYDLLNRLSLKTYSDGTPSVTYTYDSTSVPNAIGRLTSVASSVSVRSLQQYDALGRITQSAQTTAGQSYAFGYGYNLAGAVTSETYPSGRVVATTYDQAGRASSVGGTTASGSKSYASSMQYAAHGAVSLLQLGNGLWEKTAFNTRLQPVEIGLGTQSSADGVVGLFFTYSTGSSHNNNDNVLTQSITAPGLAQVLTQVYSYDGLNRLTQAVESAGPGASWSQTYDYDPYGNRAVRSTSTYIPVPALTPQLLSGFDPSTNRWSGAVYDAAGNIISDLFRSFTYNAENRQTSIYVPSFGTSTYAYDGDGRRVQRQSAGVSTVYVYDVFGHLAAEYSNQLTTFTGTTFLTADHLGSIRVATDAGGNIVARHDFLPFGEEIDASYGGRSASAGYSGADGVNQRFIAKERDGESGLDYFIVRYLSSHQGRFQSPDLFSADSDVTDPQSWNLYRYGRNNPLTFVDRNGRFSIMSVFAKAADVTRAIVASFSNSTKQVVNGLMTGLDAFGLSSVTVAKNAVPLSLVGSASHYTLGKLGIKQPEQALKWADKQVTSIQVGVAKDLVQHTSAGLGISVSPADAESDAKIVASVTDVSAMLLELPKAVANIGKLQTTINVNNMLGGSYAGPAWNQAWKILDTLYGVQHDSSEALGVGADRH